MKKILALLLVIVMALGCLASCKKDDDFPEVLPTNEALIAERIETFLTAYNMGDMDTVLECLDAKTRNAFQAMLNLLGGLAGSAAGFDIDLKDLFSLGVSTTQGDFMGLEIRDINVIDSSNAVATTTMNLTGAGVQTIYFEMVYENNGWYIHDMTDKKPTTTNPGQNDSIEGDILPAWRGNFFDDVACIFYTENEIKYVGLINRNGEIFYSYDESLGVSNYKIIGDGKTALTKYVDYGNEELLYIVDEKGNVTERFEEGLRLLAYGDGLTLVYQRKETITEVKHLYGVLNSSGEWLHPLTDLGYYPQSGWDYTHYYVGDGVFAIMVRCWAGNGGDDFIFLNSDTGTTFYISRLRNQLCQFSNGITFVYGAQDWSDIVNPYYKGTESEGVDAPAYYLLYNDGRYEEYCMDGKNFKGYSNGYLWYTVDGDESNVYIEDITSSNKNTFTYSEYPASMVESIEFNGAYALMTIRGANGNLYFTLIDKNGNQQFEPIETTSYSSFSGTHWVVFSDEKIIFENTDKKYCIANKKGEVIVTDYAYIGAFTNNIAVACIGESQYDKDALWIYINENNKQVMKTVKKL